MTDLHSELPQGADGDTGDRSMMVRRDDRALLGATNTGHSLEGEEYIVEVFEKYRIVGGCVQVHRACKL